MAAGVAGPRPGVTGARPAVQRSRSRSCTRCGPSRMSRSRASGTRSRTPGINPRPALDVFGQLRTLTEQAGRELVLTRYTEPEPELSLLLEKLKLELPAQPPPKITAGPVPPTPL